MIAPALALVVVVVVVEVIKVGVGVCSELVDLRDSVRSMSHPFWHDNDHVNDYVHERERVYEA